MKEKKKQSWVEDEKDIANKRWFNLLWFVLFMVALIIGSKGIALDMGWKSYFIAIFSVIMLSIQQEMFYHKIKYLENKQK